MEALFLAQQQTPLQTACPARVVYMWKLPLGNAP